MYISLCLILQYKQELYLLYLETIKKNPKAQGQEHGWWFLKFKWFLCSRYRKEEKRINHEHELERIYGNGDIKENQREYEPGYITASRENKDDEVGESCECDDSVSRWL